MSYRVTITYDYDDPFTLCNIDVDTESAAANITIEHAVEAGRKGPIKEIVAEIEK
jgi:hypothetical protein